MVSKEELLEENRDLRLEVEKLKADLYDTIPSVDSELVMQKYNKFVKNLDPEFKSSSYLGQMYLTLGDFNYPLGVDFTVDMNRRFEIKSVTGMDAECEMAAAIQEKLEAEIRYAIRILVIVGMGAIHSQWKV